MSGQDALVNYNHVSLICKAFVYKEKLKSTVSLHRLLAQFVVLCVKHYTPGGDSHKWLLLKALPVRVLPIRVLLCTHSKDMQLATLNMPFCVYVHVHRQRV